MSLEELNRIFIDTPDMVDFFTEHAGVPLPGGTYTQVLVANTAGQEAAEFSMLSDAYGRAVLNDPTAISLIAHERLESSQRQRSNDRLSEGRVCSAHAS